MNLGTALVAVRADIKDLKKDLDKTRTEFDRHTNQLQKQADRGKTAFNKMWLAYTAGAAAALIAGTKLLNMGARLVKDYEAQRKAVAGMETALRSMGRYTPGLSADLQEYAAALQEVTNFGDEATLQGVKFLATYRDITDNLMPRSIAIMQDLAALMGDGPGGLVRAANMLGKASMGMTGELRRVGITIDQATFQAGGYAAVLEQIAQQVEGQARAMADPWTQLSNLIGDTRENLGGLVSIAFEDYARDIIGLLGEMNEGFQTLNQRILQTRRVFIESQIRMYEAALETQQITMDLPGTMAPDFPIPLNADDVQAYTQRLKALRQELAGIQAAIGAGPGGAGAPPGGGGAEPISMFFGENPQDFINEEMERFLMLQMMQKTHGDTVLTQQLAFQDALRIATEDFYQEEQERLLAAKMVELGIIQQVEEQKQKITAAGAQTLLGIVVGNLNTIAANTKFAQDAIFRITKAFQAAQAVIHAWAAYAQALAIIPPPFNIPFANAVLGLGLAAAAAIGSQAITGPTGGGGGGVPGAAVPLQTPAGPAIPVATEPAFQGQAGLTIIIEGDVLSDEFYIEKLAEKISEAVQDRDVRLIATETRSI